MSAIPFFSSCVDWPQGRLPALMYLVAHGDDVTRETFRRRVRPPATRLWDAPGLHPRDAWHVHYRRLPGFAVYWYVHSMIEYVFATPESVAAVQARALQALVAGESW